MWRRRGGGSRGRFDHKDSYSYTDATALFLKKEIGGHVQFASVY